MNANKTPERVQHSSSCSAKPAPKVPFDYAVQSLHGNVRCRLHLTGGAKILDTLLRSRAHRVNKSIADEGGKQGNQKQEADFKALP